VTDATALAAAIAEGRVSVADVMEASLAACHAQGALGGPWCIWMKTWPAQAQRRRTSCQWTSAGRFMACLSW
jgi:hypothetical protein